MIFRLLLALTGGVGAYGAGALVVQHIETGSGCPTIGAIPICAIVLAGYVLVMAAAILPKGVRAPVFFTGWTPVAALAAVGVTLELITGDICPKTPGGIPQCYLSAALALIVLVLMMGVMRRR